MLLPPLKLREIVEDTQFADELQELEPDAIRADEFVDGAKWVLSHSPEYGTLSGKKVWFLPMGRSNAGRSLVLYYSFNADYVFFLSIQIATDEESEE